MLILSGKDTVLMGDVAVFLLFCFVGLPPFFPVPAGIPCFDA